MPQAEHRAPDDEPKPPPKCSVYLGDEGRYCGATEGVRKYLNHYGCPKHTPAAIAGRSEPQPGPGWPASAWTTPSPQSASRVHDEQAVASGKRRSSPHTYRAAQTAVAARKATPR